MKEVLIEGPYFEDFKKGEFLEQAPSVTINNSHATVHQMLFGDRLRLPLDQHLSLSITGKHTAVANPSMVISVAIGQSTYATQNVMGNLFYRGLVLKKPVYLDDTLTTTTQVVALRQNKAKPGRAASGMVVLEICVKDQAGCEILHFWRCPMVPCRDPNVETGHSDDLGALSAEISHEALLSAIPNDWDLAAFRQAINGHHFDQVEEGVKVRIKARDTVTLAPELTRLTLNMAMTHTDAGASVYGQRLVYGGHTISIAAAQVLRAMPNILTLLAWRHCDHLAPVFEGDILRTELVVVKKTACLNGGGLVDLQVKVWAERGANAPSNELDIQVLDWGLVALLA